MARSLVVEIIGDSSSLEKAFARSQKSAKKFNTEMTGTVKVAHGLSRSLTGVFAGAGIVAGIKSTVMAASDMNETLSKTDDVFGSNAAAVKAWSKTLVSSFGLSSRQALDTASSFGALFGPIGLVGDEAARQSEKLTQLGADLAAFYNTDVQDALDAIRSGIVGESEPLRRYGVLLSEARVQQQAMAETGKKNAKELTNQEKALARIHIILNDTKTAQGNFAATAGNAAEQIKILKAQIDNLKVSLGAGLLPALNNTLALFSKLADNLAANTTEVHKLKVAGTGFLIRNEDIIKGLFSLKQQLQIAKAVNAEIAKQRQERRAHATGASRAEEARARGAGDIGAPAGPTPADVTKAKRSAEQRNAWFDAMVGRKLDRVQDIESLNGQIRALTQIRALVQARLKITDDVTRRLALEDQALEITRQITSARKEKAAKIVAAEEQVKELQRRRAQQAAEERELAAEQRRQREQTALDWLSFGFEKAQATKGLGDDIKAIKKIIAKLREMIRLHGLTLDLARQLFEAQQQLKDLMGQNRKRRGGGGGRRPDEIAASPFVPADAFRAMPGAPRVTPRTTPSSGFGAGGMNVNSMTVNLYGVQNVKEFEGQLQKRAQARPQTRRGPV